MPLSVSTGPGQRAGACLRAECANGGPGCAVGKRAFLQAGEWQRAGESVQRQLRPGSQGDSVLLQLDEALPGGPMCRTAAAAARGGQGFPEPTSGLAALPAATALHPGRRSSPGSPAPSGDARAFPACLL